MPSPFRRQTLVADSGHRYTLIAFLPPNGPFGPGGVPGLSISDRDCFVGPGVLSAGAIFDIARCPSSSGDAAPGCGRPDGKSWWVTARRRDEMAQLVRDFDAMAERLEESVNAQSRLLNDISHELRSPLARLNVAAALARQRSGEEAHSALDRIDLEADRLNNLIGGLLTIARLESGNDSRQKSSDLSCGDDRRYCRRRGFRGSSP